MSWQGRSAGCWGPAEMAHVTCVGIAVWDLVFSVDAHPDGPGKYRAGALHEVGGGVAARAAKAVASLDGDTAFIGCIGDDPVGERIVEDLAGSGVDTGAVRRITGVASPVSAVFVDTAGERLVVNHVGSGLFEAGRLVQAEEIAGSDVVLADMRWSEGSLSALVAARTAGVPTVVDCDHDPTVGRGLEVIAAASHVVFSLPTLAALTGVLEADEALRLVGSYTDAWVAATAGPDGVYWLDDSGPCHLPAFPVDAVDTLGAGDVFHGAFSLALAENQALEAAIRFASAAAALSCTRASGRTEICDRAEVEALLGGCG